MKKIIPILFIFILACSTKNKMVKDNVKSDVSSTKIPTIDFVEKLLKKMTLEEKIGQLNQYNGFYDLTGPPPKDGDASQKFEDLKSGKVGSMLNIKGVADVRKMQKIAVEGSKHGIPLIFGYDVIHGYKTLSPIPLAEAASWDLTEIQSSARVAAKEAAASGLNWTFAPMVDIARDARWGRVMEGAGEDPYLGALIAKARVKGFQGDDLSDPLTIAACAKHFAGYGFAESGRDYNTVDISRSTLHNIVLPPFRAAADAGVATFMNSFNDFDGVAATGNSYLQREILKGKWGYKGFMVSDWGSIGEIITHGNAANGSEAAKLAITAGVDMDMESYNYKKHLKNLVDSNFVNQDLITDAARRILNIKFQLGLFQDPYKYCNEEREKAIVYAPENRVAVRKMAEKSIVLLKNETQLLPLKKGKNILVAGPMTFEKNSPLGSWRLASDDNTAVSLKEGLESKSEFKFNYLKGVNLIEGTASFFMETKINTTDPSGISETVAAAKDADVVVLAVGEHGFQSGEGRSRTKIDIPGLQQQLIEAVYAVNKNIVLLNFSGRPIDLSWADKNIPTIVQVWQLGTESGNAIANVLTGEINPSGKLPISFPRSLGQIPIYYNQKSTGRGVQNENKDLVFWSHYSDEKNDALYPFGFGLSYANFQYKNLSSTVVGENVDVTFDVTNTGSVSGTETAQVYIQDPVCRITRPVKELKHFQQFNLKAGETKKVSLTLTKKDLGYFDDKGDHFFEGGTFVIMAGGNSRDLIKSTIILK
jgi:beta-glucosidase